MIVLLAFLTTAAIMILVRLPGIMNSEADIITVEEINGVYNLREISDFGEVAVTLPPGQTYYPSKLLTPENLDSANPVSTEEYDALGADYLSQRFTLELPDNNGVYTLTLNLSGRHAMRVYVNGELVGQAGKTATTKQDTEVWENKLTCYATSKDGRMDILVQTAQFYHYRNGAKMASLSIQNTPSTPSAGLTSEDKGLLMMGAFICGAALLLCIYLLLSPTKATLYFALACLAIALRECIQTQVWTYFPISGNLSFMLEYMTVVLLTIFLSLYLGQYAKGKFLRRVQYTAIGGSVCYGICLLICDSIFYTSILLYYQGLLILCIIPGILALFWTMGFPNSEQKAALYGIGVFFLAAVSDILLYNNVFGFQHPKTPISEIAMLVFVLAQTVSLFLMNNRVLAESKAAEQKLVSEKEALKNLNQMKTEFLGNISHELKTPLTVISGYAQTTKQLVEDTKKLDGEDVSRRMNIISSEAKRLSMMVGQILDLTSMEEGRMSMKKHACHIDEIIHAAIETHYPILNKNANQLEIHFETGIPAIIIDPERISQVIINLISNSARFTTNGLIAISAKCEKNYVVICVSDTGSGIGPDIFPHVFERYFRKEKSDDGENTGTGLGLYISKHIVEEHGGKIWIESQEGQGSSVFFTLPVS